MKGMSTMTPELLGEAIVDFAFLAVFLGILGIGALIADYEIGRAHV